MTNKPLVIVTRKLPDIIETRMRELFDTKLNVDDSPMSQAELVEAVKTADVLVPTVTDKIDASVIGQAGEKLKLIANFGTGVDNIDVESARTRGITVSNTRSRALFFRDRTRSRKLSPGGMSNFETAMPTPSCPRLCCFSMSRYRRRSPHSASP